MDGNKQQKGKDRMKTKKATATNGKSAAAVVDELLGQTSSEKLTITAPKFETRTFRIRGTAPYVQNKFSNKAKEEIKAKQAAGQQGKKNTRRKPKDFDDLYKQCQHIAEGGWSGIPASSFRAAMISACRIVGFKMTVAKLSVFVEADGFDPVEGTPLVRIVKGKPQYHESMVRNATGVCDVRVRAMFQPGWEADVRIRYDAEQFTVQDVANLLMRAGMQVGVGEGRPDGKKNDGAGMGWGMFELAPEAD